MRKGIGPNNLGAPKGVGKMYGAKSVAKQTVGGKSLKEINSAADVPKSTSFEGTNYNLGMQDGAGAHYFNEGYDSTHGKKGTFKRPGDSGVYHVSREVAQPVKSLPAKKVSIKSPAKKDGAKSNKEKAAMMAEKRAAGKDSGSLRRGMKAEEFKKAGGAKLSQGQPGYKEAVANAEAAADKRMRRVNPSNM